MPDRTPRPPRGAIEYDFCQAHANGGRARISASEVFKEGRSFYVLEMKHIGEPIRFLAESDNWEEIYVRGRQEAAL
jgi:hypothetical protein